MSTNFIATHSKNNIGGIIQRKDAVFCLHVCISGYCLYSDRLFLSSFPSLPSSDYPHSFENLKLRCKAGLMGPVFDKLGP